MLETGPALMAAAKYIGHFCEDINVAFIQCKADNDNPALCVEQGKQVSICAQKVYNRTCSPLTATQLRQVEHSLQRYLQRLRPLPG